MQDDNETEWVLVETLSQFKMRYMVEVPKGKTEYALDIVAMNEATDFSQEHLLPTDIVLGCRTLTQDEAMELCDKDNDYASNWNEDLKIKSFFTPWKEKTNEPI